LTAEVVDAQVHVTAPAPAGSATASHELPSGVPRTLHVSGPEMLDAMNEAEVDAALLVTGLAAGWDNGYGLEVAHRTPARFRVVGRVDHLAPDVGDQIERFAADPASVGLRTLLLDESYAEQVQAGAYDSYLRAASRCGMPVCILGARCLDAITALIDGHPDTRFVFDHFGIGGVVPGLVKREDLELDARIPVVLGLATRDNVAVKLSGGPSLSETSYPFTDLWPLLDRFLEAYGPDRLMWGSDWTRVRVASYREGVDYLRASERLTPDVADALFGASLRKIFDWPGDP
jgi:predicted TIM-barrel fold metal-dependent hydrolase